MRERPILFSAPMVRALLAGTKTQTRRAMKLHPSAIACCCGGTAARWKVSDGDQWYCGICGGGNRLTSRDVDGIRCPYGAPGDRLWVKETHGFVTSDRDGPVHDSLVFRADGNEGWSGKWRPSIHMPRWASRITLEITGVRVERLQDISEDDAKAEGAPSSIHLPGGRFANENFAHLWWSINGDGSWDANPWVWVVEFKRIGA